MSKEKKENGGTFKDSGAQELVRDEFRKDELENAMINDEIIAVDKQSNQNEEKTSQNEGKTEEIDKSQPLVELQIQLHESNDSSPQQTVDLVIKCRQDHPQPTMMEILGMIEMAKHDLVSVSQSDVNQVAPPQPQFELVEVTLDELDFEMDVSGGLVNQGKKPGDVLKVPEPVIKMRDDARVRYLAKQKSQEEKK